MVRQKLNQSPSADQVKKPVVKRSAGMDSYELVDNFVDVHSSGIMNAH